MIKQGKKGWGIFLFCVLLLSSSVTVLAESKSDFLIDGSRLIDATEASSSELLDFKVEAVEERPVELSIYLTGGNARITNAGGGKVSLYADTKACKQCDLVEVDIYLQRYKNGSWVHVNNWNYSKKNVGYMTASRTPSVTKGYYYRIRCYHAVTKNGVKESCSTVTNGIPIK